MAARIWFILTALFFVLMNVLLWRSEIRGRSQLGSSIPLDVVWQKIITAPDDSSLDIRQHGKKIGYANWVPHIGEEAGQSISADVPPEGMVGAVSGYSIDFDGNVSAGSSLETIRFHFTLELATNHAWQSLNLRLTIRPATYIIAADAARETVTLQVDEGDEHHIRNWRFDQLRDPRLLVRQLGGPLAELAVQMDVIPSLPVDSTAALQLHWEARNDWMKLGQARLRVYRLRAHLLDRFEAAVFISPVGEILRVDLPGEITLVNDAFTSL